MAETNLGNEITSGVKKVMLAGIGALAVTAEKSKDLVDTLVKQGELTVSQGKVLNEELKRTVKSQGAKDADPVEVEAEVVSDKTATADDVDLDSMSDEQIARLRARLAALDEKRDEAAAADDGAQA